ncbi:RNA helicase required for poly(A+) mRNA export, partial [Clydaea vesicula]
MSGWGDLPAEEPGTWGAEPKVSSLPKSDWKQTNQVENLSKQVEDLSTDDVAEEKFEKKSNPLEENTTSEVEVTYAEGSSAHLYTAAISFDSLGLSPDLLKGVYSMGFEKPSKIQEKALPLLLASPAKNMIGQSQAGTGKTAAFALTILSRINFDLKTTQAICLAPVRELAVQILDNIRELGKYTKATNQLAVKESIDRTIKKIDAQIIIGTPGCVSDLIKRRVLNTTEVKIFVLDEADSMLDQGLGDQSIRVKNSLPRDAQVVLFSATFTDTLFQFAQKVAPNANLIKLKREELTVEGVKQFYMDCANLEDKLKTLVDIYGLLTIGQSIIFTRTRNMADRISQIMTERGHSVIALHGGLEGSQRDQVMEDFRKGKSKVLVATNVLSRGIDILQVTLVVNFDMPQDVDHRPDPETYLHRIGRTGRFGRTGVSINFVHDENSLMEMKAIEKHFQRKITRIPSGDVEEIEKILKK